MHQYTETPRYLLLKPFFCDMGDGHTLIPEDEEIEWEGMPNEDMQPLNQAARDMLDQFYAKLEGGKPRAAEDMVYDAYANRPRIQPQIPRENAEVTKYPVRDDSIPVTTDVKKARNRLARANQDQPKARILERPVKDRVKKPKKIMTAVDAVETLGHDTI